MNNQFGYHNCNNNSKALSHEVNSNNKPPVHPTSHLYLPRFSAMQASSSLPHAPQQEMQQQRGQKGSVLCVNNMNYNGSNCIVSQTIATKHVHEKVVKSSSRAMNVGMIPSRNHSFAVGFHSNSNGNEFDQCLPFPKTHYLNLKDLNHLVAQSSAFTKNNTNNWNNNDNYYNINNIKHMKHSHNERARNSMNYNIIDYNNNSPRRTYFANNFINSNNGSLNASHSNWNSNRNSNSSSSNLESYNYNNTNIANDNFASYNSSLCNSWSFGSDLSDNNSSFSSSISNEQQQEQQTTGFLFLPQKIRVFNSKNSKHGGKNGLVLAKNNSNYIKHKNKNNSINSTDSIDSNNNNNDNNSSKRPKLKGLFVRTNGNETVIFSEHFLHRNSSDGRSNCSQLKGFSRESLTKIGKKFDRFISIKYKNTRKISTAILVPTISVTKFGKFINTMSVLIYSKKKKCSHVKTVFCWNQSLFAKKCKNIVAVKMNNSIESDFIEKWDESNKQEFEFLFEQIKNLFDYHYCEERYSF